MLRREGGAGACGWGYGKEWIWIGRMGMERIPGLGQLTAMWESSSELGEDGVGGWEGGVVREGEEGGWSG